MNTTIFRIPEQIKLRKEITVNIGLTFLPEISNDGRYIKLHGKQQPEIHLEFLFKKTPIDYKLWNDIICQKSPYSLADGTILYIDSIHEIDLKGWEILNNYGMFPTQWINPRS